MPLDATETRPPSAGRRQPIFLPFTVQEARGASTAPTDGPARSARVRAGTVRRCAEAADFTADGCWNALLGGCRSADRALLPVRLHALVDATTTYLGPKWWYGSGSPYRRKVTEAWIRIDDAVHEGDGAEFARAFIGYDQAIATAMVSARSTVESPTR